MQPGPPLRPRPPCVGRSPAARGCCCGFIYAQVEAAFGAEFLVACRLAAAARAGAAPFLGPRRRMAGARVVASIASCVCLCAKLPFCSCKKEAPLAPGAPLPSLPDRPGAPSGFPGGLPAASARVLTRRATTACAAAPPQESQGRPRRITASPRSAPAPSATRHPSLLLAVPLGSPRRWPRRPLWSVLLGSNQPPSGRGSSLFTPSRSPTH